MLNKQPDRYELLLMASENLLGKMQNHESRITTLEQRFPLNRRDALNIRTRVVRHVGKVVGKDSPEYRKMISRLWHDYWQAFGVTSYTETPAALYDEAIAFIDRWRPIQLAGLEE